MKKLFSKAQPRIQKNDKETLGRLPIKAHPPLVIKTKFFKENTPWSFKMDSSDAMKNRLGKLCANSNTETIVKYGIYNDLCI